MNRQDFMAMLAAYRLLALAFGLFGVGLGVTTMAFIFVGPWIGAMMFLPTVLLLWVVDVVGTKAHDKALNYWNGAVAERKLMR